MDSEQLGEVVSTTLIYAIVAFAVAPNFGFDGLQGRITAALVGGVVVGLPLAAFAVLVYGGEESFLIGPWGPEDLVFLLGAAAVLAGVVYGANSIGLEGNAYWAVVGGGAILAVAAGVVVRDATVGEWPPGSGARRGGEQGPDGPF